MTTPLQKLESVAAEDDDGVRWVRASRAMEALGLHRGTYIHWRKRGHCLTVNHIITKRRRTCTDGVIVALRYDEVVRAYKSRRKVRNWSRADVEFLEDWYAVRSIPWIAQKLDRTEVAIKEKVKDLGMSLAPTNGSLGVGEVSTILGVPRSRVKVWFQRHPRELRNRSRSVSKLMSTSPKRVMAFLHNHPRIKRLIEQRRIDYMDTLASPIRRPK